MILLVLRVTTSTLYWSYTVDGLFRVVNPWN